MLSQLPVFPSINEFRLFIFSSFLIKNPNKAFDSLPRVISMNEQQNWISFVDKKQKREIVPEIAFYSLFVRG